MSERAPNLFGIPKRAAERLKDPTYHLGKSQERDTVQKEAFPGSGTATTAIEYIAESNVCPSCYVVPGFGLKGTNDKESPGEVTIDPKFGLNIDELIAVNTWLYINSGETPPPPNIIEAAYRKFIPESEWFWITRKGPEYIPPERGLLVKGDEPLDVIFSRARCIGCHIIPGIPGSTGKIGPKLTMKTKALKRIKDSAYTGNASTVKEYIMESIVYPRLYIVKPFPFYEMPEDYGERLNARTLLRMVDYLSQLEEGKAPPKIE